MMETDDRSMEIVSDLCDTKTEPNSEVYGEEREDSLSNWRNLPICQQPEYTDTLHLSTILNEVEFY